MNRTSARERLDAALAKIDDPQGEGARACLTIYREQALAAAEASDARARNGISLGPLDGAIVSIKDLFDVAGEVTRAGSKLIAAEAKPAERDAPIVRRLRQAGAVIVAKTNMTEFAFSGIGANPHFGTPGNPADRKRAPGGSTSGGAVAAADGMCELSHRQRHRRLHAHSGFALRHHSASSQAASASRPTALFRSPTRSIPSGRWQKRLCLARMPTR